MSDDTPLTNADTERLRMQGWTNLGGGERCGTPFIRAKHTTGRVADLSYAEWRKVARGEMTVRTIPWHALRNEVPQ
jgi:hypothetical protein